jgi:hypothetical protein
MRGSKVKYRNLKCSKGRKWDADVEHPARWGRTPTLGKIRPNAGTGGFHRHNPPEHKSRPPKLLL